MYRNSIYNVAIYMRLSRDDGDDRESESIENQRDIINNYISDHEDLIVYSEYSDDGYTGTNFNRPGFQKMIKDIEIGKVNCIITKDLSRFGRDHIDTGYYLERYLPLKNIRYIAIGDNVDTLNSNGLQFLTFKLGFNDYYAQDISNKVKCVKKRKQEKGEFQAGIAPYGFKKDKYKKNHLIIDEYASRIVYTIFCMYVYNDKSSADIALYLNENNILPPCIYLGIPTFMKNKSKNPNGYVWSKTQVIRILKNETYIGCVVGRKYEKVSHKVDKVRGTKKEDYIIVENKHEAIISRELWDKAQEKLAKHQFVRKSEYSHPLKKFVYCADCGAKATYKSRHTVRKNGDVKVYNTFVCSRKNMAKGCNCKSIRAEILEEKVQEKIKEEMKKIAYSKEEIKGICEKVKYISKQNIEMLNNEISKLNKELNKKEMMIKEIYNDKLNKIILQDDFNKFYSQALDEKEKILASIEKYNNELLKIRNGDKKKDYRKIIGLATNFLELKIFSNELYDEIIEKIEIDSLNKIKITLKFGQIDIVQNELLGVSQ